MNQKCDPKILFEMKSKKTIVLFTSHPPSIGGGGAILRSLVSELSSDYVFPWYYYASTPVEGYEYGWLGLPRMGHQGIIPDMIYTWRMLCSKSASYSEPALSKLKELDCDAYWIVSHNEGMKLALDLANTTQYPIHLTVHDDWAGALCARSTRYRLFGRFADLLSDRTIRSVHSVDVVSDGMRSYYYGRTGINPFVCHRYLQPLAPTDSGEMAHGNKHISVGHIGSIYSKSQLFCFVKAFKDYCKFTQVSGKVVLWGSGLKKKDVPTHLFSWIELKPTMQEEDIVKAMSKCDFMYAMYPFSGALKIFVTTSLPTKVTTYVMAQRPILGHTPQNSTLSTLLRESNIGLLWSDLDVRNGIKAIQEILHVSIQPSSWTMARDVYFGDRNLDHMRQAFNHLTLEPL